MTSDEVRALLRERLQDCSQAELADEMGISQAYLSDFLLARKEPGPTITNALGLRRVVSYERKAA